MVCIQIDNKLIDYNKIEMGIETRICFITDIEMQKMFIGVSRGPEGQRDNS